MNDDRISELSEKMGPEYFNRKLQDEVNLFKKLLSDNKRDLSKAELVGMLKCIVGHPIVEKGQFTEKVAKIAQLGCDAKDTFVALTVQVLTEEGQRRKDELSQPKFKGEEDGE